MGIELYILRTAYTIYKMQLMHLQRDLFVDKGSKEKPLITA
jgi:hypothetical protein